MTPVVLDYHRSPPPRWRGYVKRVLCVSFILIVLVGTVWAVRYASGAWSRYRDMTEYDAGYKALATYTIPADTVLLDPNSESVYTRKDYTTPSGYGYFMMLTIPTDPVVERNLRRMRRFDSFTVFPFATERQTARGKAFVYARIDARQSTPPSLTMVVFEEIQTPGEFPSYRFKNRGFVTQVDFIPSPGRPLPVILAAQPDANPFSWTLPVLIDGRKEWVRVDHSATRAVVTASFGQLTWNTLRY